MRHIIPISGKDSLCTAIVQTTREPDLKYEFVFNPTGLELPEVLEWLDRVEKRLGQRIERVGKDLHEIIIGYGYFLPGPRSRYCTKESKILPFIEWINGDLCTVYYGIRADEDREGFNNTTSPNITPVYPLVESRIDLKAVYTILNNFNLKPPTFFWAEIYERVKAKLGYDPKTFLPEWLFDRLFSWRSRPNCDRCFNQAYYEWVGFLEHHPDNFWESESWEHMGSDGDYTWNSNQKSLKQIAAEADIIKSKRVKQIVKAIRLYKQYNLFRDDDSGFIDILAVKSCGLFCGK